MKKYSYILYKYCRERTSCKITLVAFVSLFTTMYFQMSPQIACLRGCIVALVAFFYFPHWVLKCLLELHSRIGCICLTFLHCVFSNVSSNRLHKRIHSRIGCIFFIFPTAGFQMTPQCTRLRACIVTLVAFVCLFSTVYFQMFP